MSVRIPLFAQVRIDVTRIDLMRRLSGKFAFGAGDVLRSRRDSSVSPHRKQDSLSSVDDK
jgi:hypothetical protein